MKRLDETYANKMLGEYLALERAIKPMVKRKEEIALWCKENGSFHTEDYVCSVKERTIRRLAGLDRVSEVLGRDLLEANGLINVSLCLFVFVSAKTFPDEF